MYPISPEGKGLGQFLFKSGQVTHPHCLSRDEKLVEYENLTPCYICMSLSLSCRIFWFHNCRDVNDQQTFEEVLATAWLLTVLSFVMKVLFISSADTGIKTKDFFLTSQMGKKKKREYYIMTDQSA